MSLREEVAFVALLAAQMQEDDASSMKLNATTYWDFLRMKGHICNQKCHCHKQ